MKTLGYAWSVFIGSVYIWSVNIKSVILPCTWYVCDPEDLSEEGPQHDAQPHRPHHHHALEEAVDVGVVGTELEDPRHPVLQQCRLHERPNRSKGITAIEKSVELQKYGKWSK